MMGKRDHFLRGGWRGGITPFGFDTIERKLVINKEESKWVKKIFEMYSESYSTSEISNLLYSKGVKPRKSQSGIFNIGTIAVMLKNEIYIGIDRMKDPDEPEKILVYKNVPKIVDKKTFTICQNLLKLNKRNNKPTNKKTKKFPVLLRKMIRCGCCGEMWGVRLQHNVKSYQYYCRNKENKWSSRSPQRIIPECKVKRSCSIQQLDELVWRTVVRVNEESNILREKDKTKILQPINPNQSRSWKQRLNYLTKTIKDLEKKRMFLYEQFVSNEIDKEMLESLSKGIKSQVKDYQGQMTILEDNIKIKQDKDGFIDWVKKRHNKIEKMSQITDFDKRLQLVKEFVNRVELDHDKKKNRFMVNIILNLPLFNDKLLWKNKKDKKQGYTIEEGNYSEVIPFEIQSRTHFELVSSEPKKN
tara:strand:+ start:1 stop:1245 length:1245 start_codon:yes stop_codon:yes gene_type:complete